MFNTIILQHTEPLELHLFQEEGGKAWSDTQHGRAEHRRGGKRRRGGRGRRGVVWGMREEYKPIFRIAPLLA
jgi:hypothetical protein